MNIFDLILILSVLIVLTIVLGLLVSLAARRRALARRLFIGLAIYIGGYAMLLVGAALLSPQQVLGMHQPRCFDDWCASVERVKQQPAIGSVQANGAFFLVTIRVTNRARRISQRARDVGIYLLDSLGKRYNPSLEGQRALDEAGLAGSPLDSQLDAGGAFTHTAVFDVPAGTEQLGLVISHGAFPDAIVIGDEQSLFHKPTVVRLAIP